MEQLEVNGKKYKILKLLGKGKGGYSYLADDGEQTVVVSPVIIISLGIRCRRSCATMTGCTKSESQCPD